MENTKKVIACQRGVIVSYSQCVWTIEYTSKESTLNSYFRIVQDVINMSRVGLEMSFANKQKPVIHDCTRGWRVYCFSRLWFPFFSTCFFPPKMTSWCSNNKKKTSNFIHIIKYETLKEYSATVEKTSQNHQKKREILEIGNHLLLPRSLSPVFAPFFCCWFPPGWQMRRNIVMLHITGAVFTIRFGSASLWSVSGRQWATAQ